MLEASDITFSYGRWRRRLPVLRELTWKPRPGATTLLLGENGSGKSTLLKVLCGYERPSGGSVSVDGDHRRQTLFRQVGWMPQEVRAIRGLTVEEHVAYAAWMAGASRSNAPVLAREAIAAVDLASLGGRRADQLSGGQLRRLGLAQAIVRQAPILLLDEPTAGLDPAQTANFQRLITHLPCPGGLVISTHQVDVATDVDFLAVLADGKIRFDGSLDEFLVNHLRLDGSRPTLAEAFAVMVGGAG